MVRLRGEEHLLALKEGQMLGPLHGLPITTKINSDQAGLLDAGEIIEAHLGSCTPVEPGA